LGGHQANITVRKDHKGHKELNFGNHYPVYSLSLWPL
jgi:hypothetical protein